MSQAKLGPQLPALPRWALGLQASSLSTPDINPRAYIQWRRSV